MFHDLYSCEICGEVYETLPEGICYDCERIFALDLAIDITFALDRIEV
jgi:hypothetical protein